MDKRLQIHVLENVRDTGGWCWHRDEKGMSIDKNDEAERRFANSGHTQKEYYACTAMLVESGMVVTFPQRQARFSGPDLVVPPGLPYEPRCLTVSGLQYLSVIKHPVREWTRSNWFPVLVALATIATAAAGIVVNAISRPAG